jgi:polyamine oxidase
VSKWTTNPYVRGSFSNPVVGSSKADFHNLAGRVGNLFFAGEASSEKYYGFVQGGYYTGLEQAKAIINCLHNNDCPAYEPEVPEDRCDRNGGDAGLIKNSLMSMLAFVTFYAMF